MKIAHFRLPSASHCEKCACLSSLTAQTTTILCEVTHTILTSTSSQSQFSKFFCSEIVITMSFARFCCESVVDRARESDLQTEQQTSQRSKEMCSEFCTLVPSSCG